MAAEDLDIIVRLKGARAAGAEAKTLSAEIVGVGRAEEKAAIGAGKWGRAASTADKHTRRLHGGVISASKSIGGMRSRVFGLTGALGFGAGLGLLGAVQKSSERFREHQIIVRQTEAVIRSTGGAAHASAKQIDEMAMAIQRKSGIDAEQIMQGENMLLTFRGIRNEAGKGNDIFNQSVKAVSNMSAAFEASGKHMGQAEAALQLGKALNDPVKGMGRLQRIGVTFTDQQKKQAAALEKTGNIMGAQRIILRELTKEFGGSAAARGNTFQGALDRAKLAAQDLGQTLFAKAAPALTKAATATAKFITQMQTGQGAGGRFRDRVVAIWNAAKPVVLWFGRAAASVFKFASHHPALVKIAAALFLASKALKLMRFGAAISGVGRLISIFRTLVQSKFGAKIAGEVVTKVGGIPGRLGGLSGAFGSVGSVLGTALGIGIVLAVSQKVQDWFTSTFGQPLPGVGVVTNPGGLNPSQWVNPFHPNTSKQPPLQIGPHGVAVTPGFAPTRTPRHARHPQAQNAPPSASTPHSGRKVAVGPQMAGGVTEVHNHFHGPQEIRVGDETIWKANDREQRKRQARR